MLNYIQRICAWLECRRRFLPAAGILMLMFVALPSLANPVAGDLAPRGNPDGQLNVADVVVLTRLVLGLDTPNSYDYLVGDVAPLNSPDGLLNVADLVVLQRAVFGLITLPPVIDTTAPQISIIAPVDGSTISQSSVAVIGLLDEPASVLVHGTNVGIVLSFSVLVALQQGGNTINVVATDISGNIASQVINVNVDSRAPVPIAISKLTVTEPVSGQLSFDGAAGIAEPGTTIQFTNTTTSEVTTVTADIVDGSFSGLVNANTGEIIQVVVIDNIGNTSEAMAYTAGSAIQIVTPTENASIAGLAVNTTGIFTGSVGSGVSVNGVPTCIFGNTFYINNFVLQTGGNTLAATLTDPSGPGGQHSIPVTSSGNPALTFDANNQCGIAPVNVNFTIGTLSTNVRQIEIDFDGDGIPDFSAADNDTPITNVYTTPGVYIATAWVQDVQGVETELRLFIVVQDETSQDIIHQQTWTNFSAALAAGDVPLALQSIMVQARGFYNPVLQALASNLPEIAGDFSGIEKIQIGEDLAEYAVLTVVDGQVRTFVITFAKDSDGVWRIVAM